MKTFAYCAQSFKEAVRKAAGVEPLTCPPASADTFNTMRLMGNGLLYFDLHGEPGSREWYGDYGLPALRANQLRGLDLIGTIVFAANCYLADENSPMLDALLDAGVKYVIAAPGQNFAGVRRVEGADLLGQWFRRFVSIHLDPLRALSMAKLQIKTLRLLTPEQRRLVLDDTLGFRAFYRQEA